MSTVPARSPRSERGEQACALLYQAPKGSERQLHEHQASAVPAWSPRSKRGEQVSAFGGEEESDHLDVWEVSWDKGGGAFWLRDKKVHTLTV